jgi:uncharacterized protein (UPF0262 family)
MARPTDKGPESSVASTQHITAITLDESSLTAQSSALEHERQVAMNDLIEWNHFALKEAEGPYTLVLKTAENRIIFTVTSQKLARPAVLAVPLAPFRSVIRDYFLICESYFEAIRTGNLPRIEAIDMSRRGLHNEGADLLASLLADKVGMDSETSRRLFTLLTVLHLK